MFSKAVTRPYQREHLQIVTPTGRRPSEANVGRQITDFNKQRRHGDMKTWADVQRDEEIQD